MLPVQRPTSSQPPLPAVAAAPKNPHTLTAKLQRIWQSCLSFFVTLFHCLFCHPFKTLKLVPAQHLLAHLDEITAKETAYRQISLSPPTTKQAAIDQEAASTKKRQDWLNAHQRAFVAAKQAITAAKLDPVHLPKEIAWQLTEIVTRFGVAIYASTQTPDPFQSALYVLKTALLLQQYALGLSPTCPDLSTLNHLEDLYHLDSTRTKYSAQADALIHSLPAERWAEKAATLNQRQLFNIPKILLYTHGAMRYLKQTTLDDSARLLGTGEACLRQAQTKPHFNQAEVNDQLAELIYNEITGFAAANISHYQGLDQTAQVKAQIKAAQAALSQRWEQCVALSKDPEKMHARCTNKRAFLEKLSPQQALNLRQEALDRHLALPETRQDRVLLALAWHNLSFAHEKVGDNKAAFKCATQALNLAVTCRAHGKDDVQLDSVVKNGKRWIQTFSGQL